MLNLFHLLSLLGLLTSLASSTALTYRLAPNEKECFYTHVEKKDAKVAFYFAVQAGGSFDGMESLHRPLRAFDTELERGN